MPPREWRLRVTDILDSIQKIERYTADMTFAAFQSDERTVDAVVPHLEIIGETLYIPARIQERHPEVPWSDANDLRNFAIHQYPDVNLAVIWDTIKNDLPPMVSQLQAILAEPPEDDAAS